MTAENLRLAATGAASGALVAVVQRDRARAAGIGSIVTALAVAVLVARPTIELGHVPGVQLLEVGIGMAVAAGGGRSIARGEHGGRTLVAVAAVVTALAVWTAVPETSGAVVVIGTLSSLTAAAVFLRWPISYRGTATMAAASVAPVAIGASFSDLRAAGAVACAGLTLWWPVGRGLRAVVARRSTAGLPTGWWLLGPHAVLAFAAARWVGAAADARWSRLALIAAAGTAVAASCRPQAMMER